MPPEPSQSAAHARRFLPQPAALSVTDDAGATHRHDVPRLWFPWIIRERDPVSRAVRREQMKAGWAQSTGAGMGLGMGLLAGVFVFVGMSSGLPIYLMYAGAFVLGSGSAWAMWWAAHRRIERHWQSLGRQWTDAGLTRGRCPLCLYNLAGAGANEHGLARCAECGAAWRHARIREISDRELPPWRRVLNHMLGVEMAKRTLCDDTGRKFAADQLAAIASRMLAHDPHLAQVVRDVRAIGVWVRMLAAAAVGGVFLVPFGIVLIMAGSALRPMIWLFLVLAWVLPALLLIGVIGHSDLGLTARARRRGMLAAGLCPVCAGRDLAPNEHRPDLSTCATCGAAWRVDAA